MKIKRNKRKSHTLNISLDFQPPIGISVKNQYLRKEPNSKTAMKTKLWIGIFLLGVCLSLPLHAQQTHRTSGWYHLYASPTDSIGQTPIVTLKDCAALELNTGPHGHYTIIGQVKEHLLEHWADETEKAIGQRIAFVWNDSILTAPRVNARITGGRFQISSRHSERLPALYREMQQEMEEPATNLAREDSLQRAREQQLWDEARQYKACITDTTYLDSRGPMSLAALDAWNGNGFNEHYAYNQTVYLAALERAQKRLTVKDGPQLAATFHSGKELYISERLYRFILETIQMWNELLKTGKFEIVKEQGYYAVAPKKD